MMQDIAERDWKIAKTLHAIAMERAFDRAIAEISRLIADDKEIKQERFWNVHEFQKRAKKELADAFDNFRRSSAVLQLAIMQSRGLLTDEEIARLGPEVRERLSVMQRGFD